VEPLVGQRRSTRTSQRAFNPFCDDQEEGIYSDFSDRVARALEAGTEFLGVGVCREAWLLVAFVRGVGFGVSKNCRRGFSGPSITAVRQ
jgi:hypothetical protein